MIFYEKCLPADNSHEISCLICLKKQQNLKLSSAAIVGGALWPNYTSVAEDCYI